MIRKTVCNYAACPLTDCDKHVKNIADSGYFVFVDLAPTCRRYISYLVDEAAQEQRGNK